MALAVFLALVASAHAVADSGTIVFRRAVHTNGAAITLGEAANLSALPERLRSRAASQVLIDVHLARAGRSIAHRALAARLRARMPGLRPWLASDYTGVLDLGVARQRVGSIVAVVDGGEGVGSGADVTVRLTTGIFVIERKGRAMQSAKSGERLFVRTPDGVLAAECCRGEQR